MGESGRGFAIEAGALIRKFTVLYTGMEDIAYI